MDWLTVLKKKSADYLKLMSNPQPQADLEILLEVHKPKKELPKKVKK